MGAAGDKNGAEIVKMLLSAGADVSPKDKKGKTALDFAKNKEIEKLLTDAGAKK